MSRHGHTDKIGEILIEAKLISPEQLERALEEQAATQEKVGRILVSQGAVTHRDLLICLSNQLGLSISALDIFDRETELAKERADFFTKIFGLRCSLMITRLFLQLNLSENVATLMMFVLGMIGALLMLFNDYTIMFGLLFLLGYYIFDYVDGQLARFHKHCSLLGAAEDRLVHLFVEELSLAFLGAWLFKTYQHWSLLVITLILLFWNRFSKYIAHLHVMIYVCEFMTYPLSERKIIRKNYEKKIEIVQEQELQQSSSKKDSDEDVAPKPDPKPSLRDYLTQIRISSYSFNFFTIIVLFVSILECVCLLFHQYFHLKLIALCVFSMYYLLSIFDLSYTYLFTDRIYMQVRNLEHTLRNNMDRDGT